MGARSDSQEDSDIATYFYTRGIRSLLLLLLYLSFNPLCVRVFLMILLRIFVLLLKPNLIPRGDGRHKWETLVTNFFLSESVRRADTIVVPWQPTRDWHATPMDEDRDSCALVLPSAAKRYRRRTAQ